MLSIFAAAHRTSAEAALKADHPAARDAHLELAVRYDEFAAAIASAEEQLNPQDQLIVTASRNESWWTSFPSLSRTSMN